MKFITADNLNYQICPNCSTEHSFVYHPNGDCPHAHLICLVCGTSHGSELTGVRLGYGSQYDEEYICYKCLDQMIAEKTWGLR